MFVFPSSHDTLRARNTHATLSRRKHTYPSSSLSVSPLSLCVNFAPGLRLFISPRFHRHYPFSSSPLYCDRFKKLTETLHELDRLEIVARGSVVTTRPDYLEAEELKAAVKDLQEDYEVEVIYMKTFDVGSLRVAKRQKQAYKS